MVDRSARALCAALLAFAPLPLAAQTPAATPAEQAEPAQEERLDAADHAESRRVAAIVGDLGLPALQPVTFESPRDTLELADRFPVVPTDLARYKELAPATYAQGLLPSGSDGTGTEKPELFWYQLPAGHDQGAKKGQKVPLVVAYHGFGSSAASVASQTTIDEECNARGWLYLAPTGIDDKIFGSPISQANTEAAIRWMIDEHQVDPDRIYMVGFSMGGGVVANFAAKHRDPAGIVIAAVGVVSGTFDWACAWELGTPTLKTLLEHPYNFGGPPSQALAEYQASSALCFEAGSYPPLPGKLEGALSAAADLTDVPIFVTWDEGDTLPEVGAHQPEMVGLLKSVGRTVEAKPVTGTPVTHSWAVLDETALFDFFAQHAAPRPPVAAEAAAPLEEGLGKEGGEAR